MPQAAQVASDSCWLDTTSCFVACPGRLRSPPTVVDSSPLPVSLPGQVDSDPMVVDSTSLPVSSPAQVATHDLQHPNFQSDDCFVGADEDDEDSYDVSRRDVLSAYFFVPLDLEPMPITTLDDLLYYRYGFSLNDSEYPYTGIPSSFDGKTHHLRGLTEACRAVGGHQLQSSALNGQAIVDFLSILAGCKNPFKEVPGKYWDLSPLGRNPIVDLSRVFISIEEKQFTDTTTKKSPDSIEYFISLSPGFLVHTERNTSWCLSVDSMTALECIRRGLGPQSVDIANFFINYGVRFRTFQRIQNSPDSVIPPPPQCRYLGYRSPDHLLIWPTLLDMKYFAIPSSVHSHMDPLLSSCVRVALLHAWRGRFFQTLVPFQGPLLTRKHWLVTVHVLFAMTRFMWRMNLRNLKYGSFVAHMRWPNHTIQV
jgi:hypothetical protein